MTRDSSGAIVNDDLVRGAQFIFDRADFMQKPVSVNLSLGSDFGPHDGTLDWEEALAAYVGPDHPGHALVASAGNSGDIASAPVHQSVEVSKGSQTTVPIQTQGATNGALEVCGSPCGDGASLSTSGSNGPGRPVDLAHPGRERRGEEHERLRLRRHQRQLAREEPDPDGLAGGGRRGERTVAGGDVRRNARRGRHRRSQYLGRARGAVAIGPPPTGAGFVAPVREGTINLPATNPLIIGVGCTTNRTSWTSINRSIQSLTEPVLDPVGGTPMLDSSGQHRSSGAVSSGEMCWFSSAGPTITRVPKPEISAPGGVVVGAMSGQALPGTG